MVKDKCVGFIDILSTILCLSFIFLLSLNSIADQLFTVQVAASKTQMSIPQFAKTNNISDSIQEIRFDGWYRYCIGRFENLQLASKYAAEFKKKTGISEAFPRPIVWETASSAKSATQVLTLDSVKNDSVNLATLTRTVTYEASSVPSTKGKYLKPREKSMVLWLVGDSDIYEFKNDLIKYGQNNFPPPVQKAYKKVVLKIYAYPILLFFSMLILLFAANVIIVVLILYSSNQSKNRKEKYIRVYRNMYEGVLRSYIFGEIEWDFANRKLKGLKKRLNRRIMASVLADFQNNLRGGMDGQLVEIYSKLGLYRDAIRMTRYGLFYQKIVAIRELTSLSPEYGAGVVKKFINHPHYLVRAEAQTAYVTLHPDNPFDFLKNLTTPFTRWTQINVFYFFRLNQLTVPAFAEFLESDNARVRNFALRMLTYFQQLENADEVLKLLDNPSELTRFLAIKAINDLRVFRGKEKLKEMYLEEPAKNRIEIIRAIKNIGNSDDFEFLESIVQTGTISEKTEVSRSLYFMGTEGKDYLEQLNRNLNGELDKYILHILDPRN